MNKRQMITVLIPAYNEAANLPDLLEALDRLSKGELEYHSITGLKPEELQDMKEYDWEFLFVNDGSNDDTLRILLDARERDGRINVVDLSRNFGKENALLAGFDYAKGDAVVIIDADLQHPVEMIPEMIHYWREGYDDVYGRRAERGPEPMARKAFSTLFYKMLKGSTKMEVVANAGDFRLMDREMVDQLRRLRETNRYTKGLYSWVGYRKKELPFYVKERVHGKSTFNFRSLFNLAMEGITSFSITPLRVATILGFFVSLLALAYIIFIIIKTCAYGEPVQGFPTIMCAILFLGGVQLISLGIIGEYIGRIYTETKSRPGYIARSVNGKRPAEPGHITED